MSDYSETGNRFEKLAFDTTRYFRENLADEIIAGVIFGLIIFTFSWAGLWVGLFVIAIAWCVRAIFRLRRYQDKNWEVILEFVALIMTLLSFFAVGLADRVDLRHLSNGLTVIIVLMAIVSLASSYNRRCTGFLPLALYFVTVVVAIRMLLSPTSIKTLDRPLIPEPPPTIIVLGTTETPESISEPPTITPVPTVTSTPTSQPTEPLSSPTQAASPTLAPSPTPGCPSLLLQPKPPGATHLVVERENVSDLAAAYGIEEWTLVQANAPYYPSLWTHPECLRVDWWLIIPLPTATPTPNI